MLSFLRKLFSYVRPYRTRLAAGLASGALFGLTSALLLLVIKVVIDLIFPSGSAPSVEEQIRKLPAVVRGLAEWLAERLPRLESPRTTAGLILAVSAVPLVMFLRSLFSYLGVYLLNWVAVRSVTDLRTELFAHLQRLSLSFFHRSPTGDLVSRISMDTTLLHRTIGYSLPILVRSPIELLSLMVLLVAQQPFLTLTILVVAPVSIIPIVIYGRKVRRSSQTIQRDLGTLSDHMQETFTGQRIVKAYNLEETTVERFRQLTRAYVSNSMRVVRASEMPGALIEVLGAVGLALLLLYLALMPVAKPTAGDFFQFVLCLVAMYKPLKELTRVNAQLEQGRAAGERVFELLDARPNVPEPAHPKPLRAEGAVIQFDGVDFAYDSTPVLRGIQLTIQPGQLVALVGSSGSGKTSLTNLLLRFYDPQRGAVRIGGTDLREVATQDLRRQVAVVTQETILFNDTIRQNIALGRKEARAADIEAAARHARVHEFAIEKPQGYDTIVGEKGMNLSGGQRQRLAIARAIVRNAPILILDEATSALDSESERAVQEALEDLMRGRTTLCIAHRLSTVQKADAIVVLEQGRIVETGRHDELLACGGIYARLHALQFQG